VRAQVNPENRTSAHKSVAQVHTHTPPPKEGGVCLCAPRARHLCTCALVQLCDPTPQEVARSVRDGFGEGVKLYRGSDEFHAEIDAGWRESIAAPPFGPKHVGWSP
jgi:hypothetical protein